jgi:hypothetical protein
VALVAIAPLRGVCTSKSISAVLLGTSSESTRQQSVAGAHTAQKHTAGSFPFANPNLPAIPPNQTELEKKNLAQISKETRPKT